MAKSVPAIFLDRDGTINVDHGYVHEIDNFEFIDGVIDAMRELKKMGFALVVVTNQSGIARGKFTEAQFETLTEWMDWSLADRGVDLDGIYYCPHHPHKGYEGERPELKIDCDCRKPKPGMLLKVAADFNIDLSKSWMVGDGENDIQAGINAGRTSRKGIWLLTQPRFGASVRQAHTFYAALLSSRKWRSRPHFPHRYIPPDQRYWVCDAAAS